MIYVRNLVSTLTSGTCTLVVIFLYNLLYSHLLFDAKNTYIITKNALVCLCVPVYYGRTMFITYWHRSGVFVTYMIFIYLFYIYTIFQQFSKLGLTCIILNITKKWSSSNLICICALVSHTNKTPCYVRDIVDTAKSPSYI